MRAIGLLAVAIATPALAALEPPPPEIPARLALEDALRILRQRGLDLLVAEAAVASAEGDVRIAGAIPNPVASGSVGKSFDCGPGGCPALAWTAGLSDSAALVDALSGKRGLRLDVARAALAAARLSRGDAERTLSFQVKQQFLQVLVSGRGLDYAREAQAAATEMLGLTQVRFRAGAISEADLARVEVQKLEADQAVESATMTLRQAKVALAFLLGVRGPLPPFEVAAPEMLRATPVARLEKATVESLLADARARRPDLAAAEAQRQRAAASEALARRQRFPDITLSLEYAQQGSGPTAITPPTASVGLSMPLPVLYQQQGEIAKAEADVRTQALARAKVEASVASDVEGGLAAYGASRRLAERMEARLLERARTARDLVRIQYQKGAASLLDYLDAERTYIGTQVEYVNDLAAYWTAVFQLEQAVGEELR